MGKWVGYQYSDLTEWLSVCEPLLNAWPLNVIKFRGTMTYIVEFKQPGINAIISDTRISRRVSRLEWIGRNQALKTGILFPGCIFGRLGDDQASREFVISFKQSIWGIKDTPIGYWQRFKEFVESYKFRGGSDNRFKLILSQRAFDEPSSYVLDSDSGLKDNQVYNGYCSIRTYGSGKAILDSFVNQNFAPSLKLLQKDLIKEEKIPLGWVKLISPYFLCLWLSELSMTFEQSQLEKHLVGGVFHFVYQTNITEASQKPAIYIFSSANKNTRIIYSWIYKTAYIEGGLYVESHTPSGQDKNTAGMVVRDIFFDTASRSDISIIDQDLIRKRIEAELKTQSYYFFCGFGFTPPLDRKSWGFLASTRGKKEDLFDKDGQLNSELQNLIQSNFDDTL